MPESEDGTPKPGHFLPGGSAEPAAGTRPLTLRSRAEFTSFFEGLELVEPGIVYLPEWHPEEIESKATKKLANDPAFVGHLCGLGRKP